MREFSSRWSAETSLLAGAFLCKYYRTQGCGFCVTVHFIRGYHEIGTHKPKLSFTEIIRDASGDPILGVDCKPIKQTHGHTWITNYTHTCKTSLATVIESPITGQMVIMKNFTPEQQEYLKMMAKTNIAPPCLYRVMLSMYPGVGWEKEWFREHVRGLRDQIKKESPNPFLRLQTLRDNIMRTGGKLVFGYNYDGSIESFNLVTANMQKFGSVYGTYAQLDGSNQGNQFSGYTNLKLQTSDCFGHSVSLAFGSSAGGETSENAKTLITEAGLEGKLNLGTDQGSAWHQLKTGFVNDHYYCTWHLVDGTPNAKCKSEHDTLKDRVAKVLNKSFDYDPKRAWELSALWGNMEFDFPHYKKFLSKLWVDKEKLCKYFRRTFTNGRQATLSSNWTRDADVEFKFPCGRSISTKIPHERYPSSMAGNTFRVISAGVTNVFSEEHLQRAPLWSAHQMP